MQRAVLLDIDGTLLDSNDAHAAAWVEALQHFGFTKSFAEVRRGIGMGGDNLLPALISIEKESEQGLRLSDYRGDLFRQKYMSTLQPTAGSRARATP